MNTHTIVFPGIQQAREKIQQICQDAKITHQNYQPRLATTINSSTGVLPDSSRDKDIEQNYDQRYQPNKTSEKTFIKQEMNETDLSEQYCQPKGTSLPSGIKTGISNRVGQELVLSSVPLIQKQVIESANNGASVQNLKCKWGSPVQGPESPKRALAQGPKLTYKAPVQGRKSAYTFGAAVQGPKLDNLVPIQGIKSTCGASIQDRKLNSGAPKQNEYMANITQMVNIPRVHSSQAADGVHSKGAKPTHASQPKKSKIITPTSITVSKTLGSKSTPDKPLEPTGQRRLKLYRSPRPNSASQKNQSKSEVRNWIGATMHGSADFKKQVELMNGKSLPQGVSTFGRTANPVQGLGIRYAIPSQVTGTRSAVGGGMIKGKAERSWEMDLTKIKKEPGVDAYEKKKRKSKPSE